MDDRADDAPLDPTLRQVLHQAYRRPVDVDVAASHLWRITAAADRAGVAAEQRRTRPVRALAAAGVAALLIPIGAVTATQAGDALPGDFLYGVKRGTEQVQLVLNRDPERHSALHLRIAQTRLWEADQLGPDAPLTGRVALLESAIASLAEVDADVVGLAVDADELWTAAGHHLAALEATLPSDTHAELAAALHDIELPTVAAAEMGDVSVPSDEGAASAPTVVPPDDDALVEDGDGAAPGAAVETEDDPDVAAGGDDSQDDNDAQEGDDGQDAGGSDGDGGDDGVEVAAEDADEVPAPSDPLGELDRIGPDDEPAAPAEEPVAVIPAPDPEPHDVVDDVGGSEDAAPAESVPEDERPTRPVITRSG